jgi:hypothetical protein
VRTDLLVVGWREQGDGVCIGDACLRLPWDWSQALDGSRLTMTTPCSPFLGCCSST